MTSDGTTEADHDYARLDNVLRSAYAQAAHGKGKERHANNKPFDEQPIIEIARMVGPGFTTGQAMKKLQEATGMFYRGLHEAAKRELLGAIVYAAAAHILIDEAPEQEDAQMGFDFPATNNI